MKKVDDDAILKRFQNGDVSAFRELVVAYQDNIYSLCTYMTGDPVNAEDIAQDVFLKAYQSLKNFKPNASIYTWLYRIAVNACIDYKRKASLESLFRYQQHDDAEIEDEPSDDPSPERAIESQQDRNSVKRALARLSQKLRAVIVMKEMDGLSYEEIAESLDISIGTVKSRISRAREELKRIMLRKNS